MQIWFHFSFKVSKKPHTKTIVAEKQFYFIIDRLWSVFFCVRGRKGHVGAE